jgi:hypothetical protein
MPDTTNATIAKLRGWTQDQQGRWHDPDGFLIPFGPPRYDSRPATTPNGMRRRSCWRSALR